MRGALYGRVPTGWRVQRLKYNTYIKGRVGWQNLRADEFTTSGPYLITGMHFKDGEVDWGSCYHVSQDRYEVAPEIQARSDDVLVTKDGTIGKIAHVRELPGRACLNSHLLILRPLADQYVGRFLYWLLLSDVFQLFVTREQAGTTFFGITQQAISNFPAFLPPFEVQRAIAEFLDRETAKIDELIAKKNTLVSRLIAQRESATAEMVAGQSHTGPRIEVSTEWLGTLPAEWRLLKLGQVATVVRGASPRPAGSPEFFNGDGAPWITVAELTKDSKKYLFETETRLTPLGEAQSRLIPAGTLLLTNSGATLGVPKITRVSGCINDGSVALLSIRSDVCKDFLYYYLASLTSNFRERTKQGAGQPNLNTNIVKNTPLPLPPVPVQHSIAEELDRLWDVSERCRSQVIRALGRLREYRSALISAAVTGQIDVRNYRSREAVCQ